MLFYDNPWHDKLVAREKAEREARREAERMEAAKRDAEEQAATTRRRREKARSTDWAPRCRRTRLSRRFRRWLTKSFAAETKVHLVMDLETGRVFPAVLAYLDLAQENVWFARRWYGERFYWRHQITTLGEIAR